MKVDPAKITNKKGRKGKSSKAAWETLLSGSQNDSSGNINGRSPSPDKRNGYKHVQWSDDDDDEEDDYDKYNSSITPNASLNFSGDRSQSFESLWRAAANGRSSSSLNRSFESQRIPISDFQVHTGQPPIPKEIVAKIREGRYINFQEILPENLERETTDSNKSIDETERVDDITKWTDCMAAYIAVFTCDHPNRIRDLLAYQGIITKLYRECQDKRAWQRYDVAFRRKASQNELKNWSTVDENLWIMASSRDARRAVLCKACLSLAHDQASCPFVLKEESSRKRHSW